VSDGTTFPSRERLLDEPDNGPSRKGGVTMTRKKLITVVLLVVGSIGGCAALGTQTEQAASLIHEWTEPALRALVSASAPPITGQLPF
jgi:hypothetical protein